MSCFLKDGANLGSLVNQQDGLKSEDISDVLQSAASMPTSSKQNMATNLIPLNVSPNTVLNNQKAIENKALNTLIAKENIVEIRDKLELEEKTQYQN